VEAYGGAASLVNFDGDHNRSASQYVAACCSVLQYITGLRCSVLQCFAVCSSVLHCVAPFHVCCSAFWCSVLRCVVLQCDAGTLQCAIVSYSVVSTVARCCDCALVVIIISMCCSLLQCVAVCGSVL